MRVLAFCKRLFFPKKKGVAMAKSRKDNKGRVLRKGESYRSSDGKYQYSYVDETRKDLAERTFAGYMYQYNAYVRRGIGNRKVKDIKYSDVLLFYKKLMEESNLS